MADYHTAAMNYLFLDITAISGSPSSSEESCTDIYAYFKLF